MPIYRGTTPITALYRGTAPILNVYRGTTLIWSPGGARDDFERDDGPLGSDWVDLGPSTDRKLGIEDGRVRLQTPEGALGGIFDVRDSRYRHITQATSGDGYISARFGTKGAGTGFLIAAPVFDVMARGNNTGSTHTHGVGIRVVSGHAYLVSRTASATTVRGDGGTFQPGDDLLHTFVGNLHTLYVAGQQKAVWNDFGGLALNTASYRSLIIHGDGYKEFLGPRRYAPALDRVAMG